MNQAKNFVICMKHSLTCEAIGVKYGKKFTFMYTTYMQVQSVCINFIILCLFG